LGIIFFNSLQNGIKPNPRLSLGLGLKQNYCWRKFVGENSDKGTRFPSSRLCLGLICL